MRIMPLPRLVLHMRRRYRDPSLLLLGRIVYRIKRPYLYPGVLLRQYLRDRCRQCRLPVVHMPDRSDVYMRFRPLEFLLRHRFFLPIS